LNTIITDRKVIVVLIYMK